MPTTKTYTVYKFEELSAEAQELAIQKWNEQDDLAFLSDDMDYKLDELLKEHHITSDDATPYYSLSYCQGDGAMFQGKLNWKGYYVDIKQTGRYYHSHSKEIDICTEENEQVADAFYQEFEEIYQSICTTLEKYGYDCIETAQSPENVADILQANDYDFTLDGSIDYN